MALLDLWKNNKEQLASKHIQQVIAFAGDGKLGDGSSSSLELREYLMTIPSELLAKYADQCLVDAFTNSGFALQDIVNEIGHRIGFNVTPGRYRGSTSQPGHDGIWTDVGGHKIVLEVKTTDAFTIKLNTIAEYRQELIKQGKMLLGGSSMLLVVGRQDTGDVEAQIRGSRHAWDMRMISVEALLRMVRLKEDVEDPSIIKRIHEILIPKEFTRLDQIVNIAFAAVEDVKQEEAEEDHAEGDGDQNQTPAAFHAQCISRIEKALGTSLVRQSRASFSSPDGAVRLLCLVSKFHEVPKRYWFSFHPHQDESLGSSLTAYIAFGCGSPEKLFVLPYKDFKPWLENFNKTENPKGYYWHVKIRESEKSFEMVGKPGTKNFAISKYLLKA